jgi:hypothetical protein
MLPFPQLLQLPLLLPLNKPWLLTLVLAHRFLTETAQLATLAVKTSFNPRKLFKKMLLLNILMEASNRHLSLHKLPTERVLCLLSVEDFQTTIFKTWLHTSLIKLQVTSGSENYIFCNDKMISSINESCIPFSIFKSIYYGL